MTKPTVKLNEISEVLNRPMSQELIRQRDERQRA
jgi:hypothetical protein